jgi:thiamine biosynthesis lipoprotein
VKTSLGRSTKRRAAIALLALTLAAGLVVAYFIRREVRARPDFIQQGFVMDTFATIRVPAGKEEAAQQAFAELQRLEGLFNRHDPESEVARLNAQAGRWVSVSPELLEVLVTVKDMAPATGGLFDVTVAPLLDLWGIGTDRAAVPDADALARAKERVGGDGLEVDRQGGRVRLARPNMAIDLGGIGKGYAIDRAVQVLSQAGVPAGLVEVGGDLYLLGHRGGGQPWRVGVQHPRQEGAILGTLYLAGHAVATSGDYQRFFEFEGVRYHHILDPRTGKPGRTSISVTVVARTVMEADLLSTGVFLMEPAEGLAFLEGLPDVEGIIVDLAGRVLVTSGLQDEGRLPYFRPR